MRRNTTDPKGVERDTGRWALVKRTVGEFREDGMTDWAAALTYYGLLSLFPALVALVSLVGVFADPEQATRKITEIVTEIGPSSAADTFSGPIESITANRSTAGILFVAGLATALWSASGYVGALSRASNTIYETGEGRPFWKLRPLQMAVTLVVVVLVALVAIALVLTGPIVDAVAGPLGVGDEAVTAWNIAKWPALLAAVTLIVAILYYTGPNVKLRSFKWITPGSGLAIVVWLISSALFALYVSKFGSYDKTYGTLGGVIAVMVWMWIGNLAILLGAELNAEVERRREFDEQVPGAEKRLRLRPREDPDRPRTA